MTFSRFTASLAARLLFARCWFFRFVVFRVVAERFSAEGILRGFKMGLEGSYISDMGRW